MELATSENFEQRYYEAKQKVRDWIEDERLVMADVKLLSSDMADHEAWVRSLRDRYSDRHMIVIGDNFHLFDIPELEAGEAKTRAMSKMISGFPTKYGITTMFSMEIPKDALKPGVRPTYTNLKNSGGISFDSKVNMNVYQELQDLEDSQLFWCDQKYMEKVIDPFGVEQYIERKLPIVEIDIDKNKVSGVKKRLFYRLEPASGRMEECTEAEQSRMRAVLEDSKSSKVPAHR
jgi:hypothetical protein